MASPANSKYGRIHFASKRHHYKSQVSLRYARRQQISMSEFIEASKRPTASVDLEDLKPERELIGDCYSDSEIQGVKENEDAFSDVSTELLHGQSPGTAKNSGNEGLTSESETETSESSDQMQTRLDSTAFSQASASPQPNLLNSQKALSPKTGKLPEIFEACSDELSFVHND